jgi:ferredoxin
MGDKNDDNKKIVIDPDICIGCGSCEGISPEYFELVDGLARPTDKEFNSEDLDLINEAVNNCPVQAISIKEISDIEEDEESAVAQKPAPAAK